MTGLDCNILVQLALADHPANAATAAVVQAEVQSGSRLVFPPLTMIEALDWVENFLANPAAGLLEPPSESLRQTLRWMRQFNLGRKRILDTHLAAMLHTAGVRRLLTSNPGDFTVFGVFEIVTP